MSKTLAIVIYTIVSPVDLSGVELKTSEPVECVANMNATIPALEANGAKIDAYCDYTGAPVTSMRPRARLWLETSPRPIARPANLIGGQ